MVTVCPHRQKESLDVKMLNKTIPPYLDDPVARRVIVFPFLLWLGASTLLALFLSVATGIAAFVLNHLTHHRGVWRNSQGLRRQSLSAPPPSRWFDQVGFIRM